MAFLWFRLSGAVHTRISREGEGAGRTAPSLGIRAGAGAGAARARPGRGARRPGRGSAAPPPGAGGPRGSRRAGAAGRPGAGAGKAGAHDASGQRAPGGERPGASLEDAGAALSPAACIRPRPGRGGGRCRRPTLPSPRGPRGQLPGRRGRRWLHGRPSRRPPLPAGRRGVRGPAGSSAAARSADTHTGERGEAPGVLLQTGGEGWRIRGPRPQRPDAVPSRHLPRAAPGPAFPGHHPASPAFGCCRNQPLDRLSYLRKPQHPASQQGSRGLGKSEGAPRG